MHTLTIAQLKTRSVPALERGLAVLELVAKSNGGLTLRELSQALPLPRSSTHCLLVALQRHGYLMRNARTGRLHVCPQTLPPRIFLGEVRTYSDVGGALLLRSHRRDQEGVYRSIFSSGPLLAGYTGRMFKPGKPRYYKGNSTGGEVSRFPFSPRRR